MGGKKQRCKYKNSGLSSGYYANHRAISVQWKDTVSLETFSVLLQHVSNLWDQPNGFQPQLALQFPGEILKEHLIYEPHQLNTNILGRGPRIGQGSYNDHFNKHVSQHQEDRVSGFAVEVMGVLVVVRGGRCAKLLEATSVFAGPQTDLSYPH